MLGTIGEFELPLLLPDSLEKNRGTYQAMIKKAMENINLFAKSRNWNFYTNTFLINQVEIFSTKEDFDKAVCMAFGLEENVIIPKTASAIVANDHLLMVSPEVYLDIYPQGYESDFYEKLIIHELAHQLHIRILHGEEEKMGPKWFFEGFAIHTAKQFQDRPQQLNKDEIWGIIETDKDSGYQIYKEVIEYVLEKINLQDLVEKAGEANFKEFIRSKCFL
ncbi:hypothetical protein [Neobacillus sp. D3-1R]|uniref:hypothetical protein n=1 Tax=Neobacillus sp. D3-1R TaxID=3445778 RepID=UPI003FA1138E